MLDDLPHIIAALNATSAVLVLLAYVLVRRGRWRAHGMIMTLALVCSTLFLVGYVTLKLNRPPKSFAVQGQIIRPVYFAILLTNTILAIVIVPLVATVVWRAIRRHWAGHTRLARWTLPLWFYVSVTGVVIYWMLYHMPS